MDDLATSVVAGCFRVVLRKDEARLSPGPVTLAESPIPDESAEPCADPEAPGSAAAPNSAAHLQTLTQILAHSHRGCLKERESWEPETL